MTTPATVLPSSANIGGAGGTLMGANVLQQSIDTLTNAVNNLSTRMNALNQGTTSPTSGGSGGFGGGPTTRFPSAIGGGGPGGAGNVAPPAPFGSGSNAASFGGGVAAVASSISGYGQQQLPIQIGLNAYATQTALAQGQRSDNFTLQYRQAFGYQNANLNFLASSPLDAIAATQGLQYLAGNPTFMGTPIGRAGVGFASAFGTANPLASGQQSVAFAQQMTNPQTSMMMMAMGYPVTPRTLGRGGANLPASVVQGMLRAWYGQKRVNPGTLTAGLGQGGKANLNLQALGLDPTSVAPVLEEYNQLFNAGLSPEQAQRLINQSKFGTPAQATAAQQRLSQLGIKTATSSAQLMRNNQAILTGRDANVASGFARGLADATKILSVFNQVLSSVMTKLHINGLTGWSGGFSGIMSGTNSGNVGLGLGGITGILGSVAGFFGVAAGTSNVGGKPRDGMIPGYKPGVDDFPAMLSRGEAVLNPGAARALGRNNIERINAKYRAPGARSGFKNGTTRAAAGITGYENPFRSVANLVPERIDMGVDYSGSPGSPVYAIGPGVITNLYNAGWPGGAFISYRFTGGPDKGRYVYVAENITPSVRIGQNVGPNTVIGRLTGGIETGWAQPPGSGNTMAAVSGQIPASGDPGAHPTGYGISFNNLLKMVGAPGGKGGGGGLTSTSTTQQQSSSSAALGGSSSSGIGFNEASAIPNISEISALLSGMGSRIPPGMTNTMMTTSPTPAKTGKLGSIPGIGGTPAQNKVLMQKLAAAFGWGSGAQWSALNALEMHEAKYNQFAQNPSSTAYGIGQFLNSTWSSFGPKTSDPRKQEIYMLEYIKQRYGSPLKAWSNYFNQFGPGIPGYGEGGTLKGGLSIVGDRGPEILVGGSGSKVIDNARSMALLNSGKKPAQTPWTNVHDKNTAGTALSHRPVHMHFGKESMIIRVDHAGSDAASSGRQIGKEFLKWLSDEELNFTIAMGDKG